MEVPQTIYLDSYRVDLVDYVNVKLSFEHETGSVDEIVRSVFQLIARSIISRRRMLGLPYCKEGDYQAALQILNDIDSGIIGRIGKQKVKGKIVSSSEKKMRLEDETNQ